MRANFLAFPRACSISLPAMARFHISNHGERVSSLKRKSLPCGSRIMENILHVRLVKQPNPELNNQAAMKKKIPKKNSIDGTNLPDSCLVELLDRCIISIKDIKRKTKKKKQDGTENPTERTDLPTEPVGTTVAGGIYAQQGQLQ